MLAIQAKWLQEAVEDYMRETSLLMGVDSKFMSGLVP
jgi:hypothetical protein